MKKMYFLYVAALCFLFACKKDKGEENDSYHITCEINGSPKTFNSTAVGVQVDEEGSAGIGITGKVSSTQSSDGIVLMIAKEEGNITAATYMSNQSGVTILCSFQEMASQIAYQTGTDLQAEATAYNKTIANPLKIVVTSISETSIKGEFNGDLYPDGELDGNKLTLTKGSFYVPLVKY